MFANIAYADTIDSFKVDNSTRWTNYVEGLTIHMGSKNTTYKYSSTTVKDKYYIHVNRGISMWDSCGISCKESSSNPMGTIYVSAMDSGATAEL